MFGSYKKKLICRGKNIENVRKKYISVVNERFHVVKDHIDYVLMKLFYETSFMHFFMTSFMQTFD